MKVKKSATMTLLEKAIEIALKAHQGQMDKAGCEYILHPLRLLTQMETQEEKIIAVLHDVLEDTDVTLQQLADIGFGKSILCALELLTRDKEKITYEDYIKKIKTHPVAAKVKIADLEDNMDMTRIKKIQEKDLQRMKKYNWAWHYLTGCD